MNIGAVRRCSCESEHPVVPGRAGSVGPEASVSRRVVEDAPWARLIVSEATTQPLLPVRAEQGRKSALSPDHTGAGGDG